MSDELKIEELEFVDFDPKEDLLKRLLGKVFHLTNSISFDGILKDGSILNNRDGNFCFNPQSEGSFGMHHGYVCFFDLRNYTRETIKEILDMYYFVNPSWHQVRHSSYVESNLVYLFLNQTVFPELIPFTAAREFLNISEKYYHCIPGAECWYPSDVPLSHIKSVLKVKIRQNIPETPKTPADILSWRPR